MNTTQRRALEKLAQKRLNAAASTHDAARRAYVGEALKIAEDAIGITTLVKKQEKLNEQIQKNKDQLDKLGYNTSRYYGNRPTINGVEVDTTNGSPYYNAVSKAVDKLVEPKRFEELEEEVMIKIWLAGDEAEVMELLKSIK